MSFILDALRKSESERQRLGNTAIADLPIARRQRGQPWWVFALSGLLVVNLAVLAVVLLRDKGMPQQSSSNPALPVTAPSQAPTITPTAPRSIAVPNATMSTSAANTLQAAAAPAAQVEYETVPASEAELANAAASVPAGPTLVRPAQALRGDPNAGLSSDARNLANAQASQDLRIDLHVYSKNTRERFVLINMRRYTEGAQLPNGATVEQITPEGVVLYQNGTRYQLNR